MTLQPSPPPDFSQEQRAQIKNILAYETDSLVEQGQNLLLKVPDYNYARMLVTGDRPVLKEVLDSQLTDEKNALRAGSAEFIVFDFSQPNDPVSVLAQGLEKVPLLTSDAVTGRSEKFSQHYPGKVLVMIGAETIPEGTNITGFLAAAVLAPTIFVSKSGIKYNEYNIKYQEALGETGARTIELL